MRHIADASLPKPWSKTLPANSNAIPHRARDLRRLAQTAHGTGARASSATEMENFLYLRASELSSENLLILNLYSSFSTTSIATLLRVAD